MEESYRKEKLNMSVEIAKPEEWEEYKKIRLEALRENPEAFGHKLEHEVMSPAEGWQWDLSFDDEPFFLLKIDNNVQGLGGIRERPDFGPGSWFIYFIYVSKGVRGKGAGEFLMKSIEEEIRRRKGKKAVLVVGQDEKQEPAVALYKKLGFIRKPENDSNEWMCMEKELK